MSLPWFRFYSEFAGDPVVQSLAFEDQRHFVVLLCLKCNGTLDRNLPAARRDAIICRGLGLDPAAGAEAKRRLQEVGLIDKNWQPSAWDKRQFQSDHSVERVRKHRKTKDSETVTPPLPKQPETVAVTHQNRTEQNRLEDKEYQCDFPIKTVAALRPNFQYVAGGAKQFIGIGEREKRHKPPAKADQAMAEHLTTHCGMDAGKAWELLLAARDPDNPDHIHAARTCEKQSREHKLGWFHAEAAE